MFELPYKALSHNRCNMAYVFGRYFVPEALFVQGDIAILVQDDFGTLVPAC